MKKFMLIAVLALASIAWATDTTSKYPSDSKFGTLDLISSADPAALDSTAYAGRVFALEHNQTVSVAATFGTAGANAVIGIIRGKVVGGTFKPDAAGSGEWATFTAQSTYTVGGRYVSKSNGFDTSNWEAAFIYVQSVSAGNVLVGWSVH